MERKHTSRKTTKTSKDKPKTAKASRSRTRKAEKIPPLTLAEWITSDSNGNPKTLRRYTEE